MQHPLFYAFLLLLLWHPAMAYDQSLGRKLAEQDNVLPRFGDMKPDYAPRNNYGAKLEPKSQIIHGAGQDHSSYDEYSALFPDHMRPLMEMTYVGIANGPEGIERWRLGVTNALEARKNQPTVLQIGLNMTYGNDNGSGATTDVAAGKLDKEIDLLLDALEAFDRPVYLRIGYEFEGEWNGYEPDDFVASFKRITQRIRDRELTNIATVWCAAGGSAGFVSTERLMSFYPGDEWVDWWAVDIFSPEEIPHPWLDTFYRMADQHKKPVMIGEATPRYVAADRGWHSWMRWFRPFFEMVRTYPQIKAISYINWDWAYWSEEYGFDWHDWGDTRIQSSDLVKQLYLNELSHPLWLHSDGNEQL